MKDYVLRDFAPGTTQVTRRYGYHRKPPGTSYGELGDLTRDDWVIASTEPDADGPYAMTRTVIYGPWRYDERDARRPDVRSEVSVDTKYVVEARFPNTDGWSFFNGGVRPAFDTVEEAREQVADHQHWFPKHAFRVVKVTTVREPVEEA